MKQEEAAQKLTQVEELLNKVFTEVTELKEMSSDVSPEIAAKIDNILGLVKNVDELNPDKAPESPATQV